MLRFRDWVFIDEVRRDLCESILVESALAEAREDLLEFYNASVKNVRLLESDEEKEKEEEEEPELDDPFTGSEYAKPVSVRPKDEESDDEEGEDDREVKATEPPAENPAEAAKRIQDLAWAVRWSAMIDRQEAVERVREIYEKQWKPLMARRSEEIGQEYDRVVKSASSDEEARREVGRKFGMSTYEVGRILNSSHNEWSVIKEEDDDFEIPSFDDDPAGDKPSFDEELGGIVSSVEPLLVRLGYLAEGDLEEGSPHERQKLLGRAMKGASEEIGNQVPEKEITKLLKSSPSKRAEVRTRLQEELHDRFSRTAMGSYMQNSKKMGSAGKGVAGSKGGRRGSVYFQGYEDIMNQGVISIMRSLTERKPTKDMSAPAWNDDLTVLTADTSTEPDAVLGSIGARMTALNATRDEARARNKTSGQAPSSTEGPSFLGSGAMQDDGTQGSIDPSDLKARDSLSTQAHRETRSEIVGAFSKAMEDLKAHDPLLALLACVWLDLNCRRDGSMPPESASKIISAVSLTSGARTAENFFSRLGIAKDTASSEEADWEMVARVRQQNIRGATRLKEIPTGEVSRTDSNWLKYKNTLRDAKNDALRWLANRMAEVLASQSDDPALGQEGPTTWNATRFLSRAYAPQIRSGTVRVEAQGSPQTEQTIKVKFFDDSRRKLLKSYDMIVQYGNNSLSFFQDYPEGFEQNDFDFSIPNEKACPFCDGSGSGCQSCDESGKVVDSKGLINMERLILDRMARSQRRAPNKAKA